MKQLLTIALLTFITISLYGCGDEDNRSAVTAVQDVKTGPLVQVDVSKGKLLYGYDSGDGLMFFKEKHLNAITVGNPEIAISMYRFVRVTPTISCAVELDEESGEPMEELVLRTESYKPSSNAKPVYLLKYKGIYSFANSMATAEQVAATFHRKAKNIKKVYADWIGRYNVCFSTIGDKKVKTTVTDTSNDKAAALRIANSKIPTPVVSVNNPKKAFKVWVGSEVNTIAGGVLEKVYVQSLVPDVTVKKILVNKGNCDTFAVNFKHHLKYGQKTHTVLDNCTASDILDIVVVSNIGDFEYSQ